MIFLEILLLLVLLLAKSSLQQDEHIVDTTLGRVVGKLDEKKHSYAYLGIPFAEPPIGKLRFRPPVPKRPWAPQVHRAFNFSHECLQSALYSGGSGGRPSRSEDCLYLNIWTPLKHKMTQAPVLFWVYGGAFIQGAASKAEYIGSRLAARGVIVVSCNYRLGALGFLVSTADGLFGNYGLDDQKLAMQWVADNIHAFGGDPQRITLFGESAGAMSIGLHFLHQERNRDTQRSLFQGVILQSNPLGYKYRNIVVANFLGTDYKELLDCEDLRCLQSESADELIHVQDTLMAVPRSIGDFFTWGPVVTDHHYQREVRLRPGPVSDITVMQPIPSLRELQNMDIPIIMGTNSHEGTVFVYTAFPTKMTKPLYLALVISFFRRAAGKVLKMYAPLAKRQAMTNDPDYRKVLSYIIGDYLFRCPNQLGASMLHSAGSAVYLYEFSLATRTPGYDMCDGLACHTAELPYVFESNDIIREKYTWFGRPEVATKNVSYLSNIVDVAGNMLGRTTSLHAVDMKVSKLMADFWSTFATFGDPNGLRVSNGYRYRPNNAPWWPRLLGDLPSARALRAVQRALRTAAATRSMGEETDPDFDFGAFDTFPDHALGIYEGSTKSKVKAFSATNSPTTGKYTHLLQFDELSEVNIVERDCVCEFWNELEYKF